MKIKSLCLTFVQLVMFSSLGYSQEKCQDGDFWQTWFEESQFVGFGNLPTTNQIGNAQLDKANQYYLGNNLNKDYSKALELYKKAASNGIDEANFSLGLMHHYGKGKLVSYEEAYDYYYKSALNNNPEAQFNLGLMERYGLGRPINLENAFNWFKKSSRQQVSKNRYQCEAFRVGLVEAQYNLSLIHI